ncbi:MAG: LuxR C-terminal-related transcriptional regulator [Anaerovoracaceae bacterium]
MNVASSIILPLYLLSIFVGIATITILFLAGIREKSKINSSFKIFMFGMLFMSVYDMIIYFNGYVLGNISDTSVLRIGTCIIAILFSFWVKLEEEFADFKEIKWFSKVAQLYGYCFSAGWLICAILLPKNAFYTIRWLMFSSDIILVLFALSTSLVYIAKVVTSNKRMLGYYMVLVSGLMLWNYCSFFWGETSVHWGNSKFVREPLDLTILFWIIINVASLRIVYYQIFKKVFLKDGTAEVEANKVFSLDERLLELKSEFGLTDRELLICKLIYEGKTNQEIADELFISESTVKTHIYNLYKKLDIKNRSGVTSLIMKSDEELHCKTNEEVGI